MRYQTAVPAPLPAATATQSSPESSQNTADVSIINRSLKELSDEEAYVRAINLSLEDAYKELAKTATRNGTFPRALPESPIELVLSLNNEFPPLDDPHGDTAIYMGAPPRMPEQSESDYDDIVNHFEQIHVVQSANLRLMGEGSRFTDDDLLNPTKSFRAERRLRKLGVLLKPEATRGGKFKYYIDLRPPEEGEEAVLLVTQLTCTKGVLSWHLASDHYRLDPEVVMGHDEFGVLSPSMAVPSPEIITNPNDDATTSAQPNQTSGNEPSNGTSGSFVQPSPPSTAPEYSPLRHWSAIERLLYAIQGHSPKLDSAPKVWTFFAIARYFGCAVHDRISSHITKWIYKHRNVNFIQCNPEVAYRIGMGIQSANLTKDAFALLVGERALLEAYSESNPKILSPLVTTVHGRKLELLDDDDRNRIDHAASSLVRRIRKVFDHLCKDMPWLRESKDYLKLDQIVGESEEEVELLTSTKTLIQHYVRSRILHVLYKFQSLCPELDAKSISTLTFRSASEDSYVSTYKALKKRNRLFTKTLWVALGQTQFDMGTTSFGEDVAVDWYWETPPYQGSEELYSVNSSNRITPIKRSTLYNKISEVNDMLYRREAMKANIAEERWSSHEQDNVHFAPSSVRPHAAEISQSSSARPTPSFQSPKRRKTFEFDEDNLAAGQSMSSGSAETGRSWRVTNHSPTQTEKTPTPVPDYARLPLRLRPAQPAVLDHGTDYQQESSNRGKLEEQSDRPVPMREKFRRIDLPSWDDEIAITSGNIQADEPARDEREETAAFPGKVFESGEDQWGWNDSESTQAASSRPTRRVLKGTAGTMPNSGAWGPNSRNIYGNQIHAHNMLQDLSRRLESICSPILYPPHIFHEECILPTNLFDTLQCLDANEYRYLPIWFPEGNDDDTGGVFASIVPNSQDESSFPPGQIKRAYNARDSDTEDGSSVVDLASQAISTVGRASKIATDGTQTVGSVSTIDSTESTPDEDLVMVDGFQNIALSVVDDDETGTVIAPRFDGDGDGDVDVSDDDDDDDTETIDGDGRQRDMSATLRAFLDEDTECHGIRHGHGHGHGQASTTTTTSDTNMEGSNTIAHADLGRASANVDMAESHDEDDDFELI